MSSTSLKMFLSKFAPEDYAWNALQHTSAITVGPGERVSVSFTDVEEETQGRSGPLTWQWIFPALGLTREIGQTPHCTYTATLEINTGDDPKGWSTLLGFSHEILPQSNEHDPRYYKIITGIPSDTEVRVKVVRTDGEDTVHSVDVGLTAA